jgi:hypothetical protein
LIQELTIEAMYGLVLVVDPDNSAVEVPDAGDQCSSTSSCVAVPVRPYVDGPVSLWLGPSVAMGDGVEVFSGELDTPGGRLAIQVPEDDRSIAIDVGAPTAEITIAVDNPADVARVWVGVNVD